MGLRRSVPLRLLWSRYGVAVGLAAGSGVDDCSGLGLALLTGDGDSLGLGEVCAVTR